MSVSIQRYELCYELDHFNFCSAVGEGVDTSVTNPEACSLSGTMLGSSYYIYNLSAAVTAPAIVSGGLTASINTALLSAFDYYSLVYSPPTSNFNDAVGVSATITSVVPTPEPAAWSVFC